MPRTGSGRLAGVRLSFALRPWKLPASALTPTLRGARNERALPVAKPGAPASILVADLAPGWYRVRSRPGLRVGHPHARTTQCPDGRDPGQGHQARDGG